MVNEVIRLEDLDAAWPRLQAKVCHAARVGLRLGLRPNLALPLPLPLTLNPAPNPITKVCGLKGVTATDGGLRKNPSPRAH